MIRALVDYALNNRFMVTALAVLLLIWGGISFHNLPVEAYPDGANNYVQVITQWPGRAAEEVEQQVTIPIEIVMNGLPHLQHLRSISIFGLSSLMLIFDDESENDWNRQKVLERLTQVTLPQGLQPQIGTDWSAVGQIYWYTLRSTNPRYDLMELRAIEDWTLLKEFKSVPNVVDVSDFGGAVREYQVRVDPNKLVAYGLSIGQVEQQLANNNVNAGGSFVEAGLQQMNVRTLGLFRTVQDIEQTVLKTQTGTALRVKDIAEVAQGPKIRLGHMARAIHRADGRIVDEDDVIQGVVLLRKGADAGPTLDAIHAKVKELNETILPPGVKVVPMLDRSDLLHYTLHTVMHNLVEGIILGDHHPFPLSLQRTCRPDCRLHHPVLFALRFNMARSGQDSGKSSFARRARFRNGRGRRSGHGGKHRSSHEPHEWVGWVENGDGAHPRCGA